MEYLSSSFRDPAGFVFRANGAVYRQVNRSARQQYDSFMASGLYDKLVAKQLLVAHEEIPDGCRQDSPECYKILKPRQIPFISYAYEWSFSQLQQAALLTLRVQSEAMKYGYTLKDASAFNVQFLDSKPIFIDTLSFDVYEEGRPWVAYKQFCQHFLVPLALMAHVDVELPKLMISHIDGIPLPLASKLLPLKTRFNYSLATHIHLHSKMQVAYGNAAGEDVATRKVKAARLSAQGLKALIESLAKAVNKLHWNMPRTEWGNYYAQTNYSNHAGEQKRVLVDRLLGAIPDKLAIIQDFGANTGEFSRIAARHCSLVVSQDIDPVAVEINYQTTLSAGPRNILPLIQNFSSPSPAIGWGNEERSSFIERSHCDALMVLALIHHLAISNNVPLRNIARLFSRLSKWLLIEFVPKSDSQVARLLATREDIFTNYTQQGFEDAFSNYFSVVDTAHVPESERRLYLMKALQ